MRGKVDIMTEKLHVRDPYMSEFEARVESVDGDWVTLDASAFYPGGGGQPQDHGTLQGLPVQGLEADGEGLRHLVPGHGLRPGDIVRGRIDWERRYRLMRAHSAEHMLFSALRRQAPELELVKISLEPGQSQVFVRGDIGWDGILRAQDEVNEAIRANLPVQRSSVHRDDLDTEEVRARLERIEGEEVSLVEIGEGRVACSGIHVMETGEIGAILVTGRSSAGRDGSAIAFMVGEEALGAALRLAGAALLASEALGSRPEDLPRSAANAKERLERQRRALRLHSREALGSMPLLDAGGPRARGGVVPMAERGDMAEAAERMRAAGETALLVSVDEGVSVVIASPEGSGLDCRRLLQDALSPLGGRGGGKEGFAQGGLTRGDCAEELLQRLLDLLREASPRG